MPNAKIMSIDPNLVPQSMLDNFYAKIEICPVYGCWLWKGFIDPNTGYGKFGIFAITGSRSQITAHRASLLLHGYSFTKAKPHALHQCPARRRHCCLIEHLYIGSNSENMMDKHNDGTMNNGDPSGSNNGRSILTEDDINPIRWRLNSGESAGSIASDYRVDRMTISLIKRGINWSHVPYKRNPHIGNFTPR